MDRLYQEEIITEIKSRNDIVSVVSEYVSLKEKGKSFWGLCPFHNEKTPSFSVNREKQLYYCFGCKAGGDVINFVMEIERLTFSQALKWLAERANIPFQEEESAAAQKQREEREWFFRIHHLAAAYYQKVLNETPAGKKVLEYLAARGISKDTAHKFGLGYAPPSWTGLVNLLKKKGVSLAKAETAGLVLGGAEGFYDRFRNRLIFPITTPRGRVAAFGARVLGEGNPKYLNSPETPIFHKGRYLYGLFQAAGSIRAKKVAVIVEGYMDVIQTHQAGIEYVVASLGTALTREQVRTLKRYTDSVIIAYDADSSGLSATIRGLDMLKEAGLKVKVAVLPAGEDPDSTVKKGGASAFLQVIEESKELFTFKSEYLLNRLDISTPEGKAEAVKVILPLLGQVNNIVARETYIKQLAERIGVSEEAIYGEWRIYRHNFRKNKQRLDIKKDSRYTKDNYYASKQGSGLQSLSPSEVSTFNLPEQGPDSGIKQLEREVLRGCLQEKSNLERINEALSGIKWSVEEYKELFDILLTYSRKDSARDNWPPPEEEIEEKHRKLYKALLAENEITALPADLYGCCRRIRQNHLNREIQKIQKEIAAATDNKKEGKMTSSDELQEKLIILNELHKRLREEFPTFSGLI